MKDPYVLLIRSSYAVGFLICKSTGYDEQLEQHNVVNILSNEGGLGSCVF